MFSTRLSHQLDERERKVVQADIANHTAPRSTINKICPKSCLQTHAHETSWHCRDTVPAELSDKSSKAKGIGTTKLLSRAKNSLLSTRDMDSSADDVVLKELKDLLKK